MTRNSIMRVEIYWKGDAAEAHGPTTTFGGIDWVCEKTENLVLVSEAGDFDPEEPPRIVVHYEDICGWHEQLSPPEEDDG